MPVMKVKGGYRWGEKGKIYPDRASAERQGRAIKASQARREKEMDEEMSKYLVIDWYEGKDKLYEGNDYRAAVRAAKEQIEDTDGECSVVLYKLGTDGEYEPYNEKYSKRSIKEAEEYIARVEVYYDTLEPIYADDDMLDAIEDEILWALSLVDYAWGDKGEVHIVVTDNTEVHVMAEIRCDSKAEVRAYERMVCERSNNSLYDIVESVLKGFGIY